MILIGLAGVARSGKDTAAAALARDMGLYRHAFADPIKRMLEPVFGNNFVAGDREQIDPISGVSYRVLMQTLGTEWGRSICPDLWTRVAKAKWEWVKKGTPVDYKKGILDNVLDGALSDFDGMVISDVRFDNEAEWIRQEGGVIVHIERPGAQKVGLQGHVSEQGVSRVPYDMVVQNEGDLVEFLHHIWHLTTLLTNPERRRPDTGPVYQLPAGA